MSTVRRARSAQLTSVLLLTASGALMMGVGCGSKLDSTECNKLRGEAFEIVNTAHNCGSDADCRRSVWPGCEKPLNNDNFAKIEPLAKKFADGQCEEEATDCPEAPAAYCKQGLCVQREASKTQDLGQPGGGEIKIE